jgi:hypothetical protein
MQHISSVETSGTNQPPTTKHQRQKANVKQQTLNDKQQTANGNVRIINQRQLSIGSNLEQRDQGGVGFGVWGLGFGFWVLGFGFWVCERTLSCSSRECCAFHGVLFQFCSAMCT